MKGWRQFFIPGEITKSIFLSLQAAYQGNLAKLITLCGSLCKLCHLIADLVSLSISFCFLSQARGMARRFAVLYSFPSPHLAFLSRTDQHTQDSAQQTILVTKKQEINRGRFFFFFFLLEMGGRAESSSAFHFQGGETLWGLIASATTKRRVWGEGVFTSLKCEICVVYLDVLSWKRWDIWQEVEQHVNSIQSTKSRLGLSKGPNARFPSPTWWSVLIWIIYMIYIINIHHCTSIVRGCMLQRCTSYKIFFLIWGVITS